MEGRRTDIIFRPFETEVDWRWFHAHVPIPILSDARGILALKDGVPYAGCVLQNWMPYSVEIHHAMPRPIVLRHGWLEVLADASLGEERLCVYSLISAGSHKSLKFHKHVGFKETGRVPNGDGPGVDLVVLSIERHEFKYRKENSNGRSISSR